MPPIPPQATSTSPPPLPEESSGSAPEDEEDTAPASSAANDSTEDPTRALFDEYVRKKMDHEEDISRLSFSRFKTSIEKTRASHGGNLQFTVTVRNGKVTLVAKKKKTEAPPPLP